MSYFIFICIIIKVNHFVLNIVLSNSVLHTIPVLLPYWNDVILSDLYNLLSLLLLSEILLVSSVYLLSALLLNLCCDFNKISLFSKQFS